MKSQHWRPRGTNVLLCALLVVACGGKKPEAQPPPRRETAEDEVRRISNRWTSTETQKSLLSPPSEISVLTVTRRSEVLLGDAETSELLEIAEQLEMRDGSTIRCSTRFEQRVEARFGRKNGQAALELIRPALSAPRRCDAPHPDPLLSEPARRGLFVLRADQLFAIEPPLDDRVYRPVSL